MQQPTLAQSAEAATATAAGGTVDPGSCRWDAQPAAQTSQRSLAGVSRSPFEEAASLPPFSRPVSASSSTAASRAGSGAAGGAAHERSPSRQHHLCGPCGITLTGSAATTSWACLAEEAAPAAPPAASDAKALMPQPPESPPQLQHLALVRSPCSAGSLPPSGIAAVTSTASTPQSPCTPPGSDPEPGRCGRRDAKLCSRCGSGSRDTPHTLREQGQCSQDAGQTAQPLPAQQASEAASLAAARPVVSAAEGAPPAATAGTRHALVRQDTLPRMLRSWWIEPSLVQFVQDAHGRLAELGRGAR